MSLPILHATEGGGQGAEKTAGSGTHRTGAPLYFLPPLASPLPVALVDRMCARSLINGICVSPLLSLSRRAMLTPFYTF